MTNPTAARIAAARAKLESWLAVLDEPEPPQGCIGERMERDVRQDTARHILQQMIEGGNDATQV